MTKFIIFYLITVKIQTSYNITKFFKVLNFGINCPGFMIGTVASSGWGLGLGEIPPEASVEKSIPFTASTLTLDIAMLLK